MIRIDIINDGTGSPEIGNYVYRVFTPFKTLAEGKITGHIRNEGWVVLVNKLINSVKKI